MKTLVSYPGTGVFAQQIALAFHEAGALEAFETTFGIRSEGPMMRFLQTLPGPIARQVRDNLLRRNLDLVPANKLRLRPCLEILRTMSSQFGCDKRHTDRIWDMMSRDFTRHVARGILKKRPDALYAYEYTASEAFDAAQRTGTARILDLPSLSSRSLQDVLRREEEQFPTCRTNEDRYFIERFPRRQARRDYEVAEANLIVCNSTVTGESHIAQGADPTKIIVVPLAAPPAAEVIHGRLTTAPLRLIWAGTMGIHKGANHFLEACRSMRSNILKIDVYGAVTLPNASLQFLPNWLQFHGSIPRAQLLREFENADALIFPTLSDGFGMVVTEAFSRGLPVITTKRAGASDLVRHLENGLIIEAHNAHAISEAMSWCLDNRIRLLHMRVAAHATAKSRQWPDYRREFVAAVDAGLRYHGWPGLVDRASPPSPNNG